MPFAFSTGNTTRSTIAIRCSPGYCVEQPEFIDSHIYLNRYSKTKNGLELAERFDLDPDVNLGWDPRIVSNGKQAYAIIIANPTATGHETLLYNLRTKQLLPIEAEDPDFFHGKNWQPYLVGEELYFVHEMVPFRIMRIDVETGNAEIVREIDVTFKLPCFHYTYPMFRGGCNAP